VALRGGLGTYFYGFLTYTVNIIMGTMLDALFLVLVPLASVL
jgi:hypothetical protein